MALTVKNFVIESLKTFYEKITPKFQETLISGVNIKTVANNSLLGSGDVVIDWEDLSGVPSVFPAESHNHDDRYLKLSGGTLTGTLTTSGANYGTQLEIWRKSDGLVSSIGFYNGATTKTLIGQIGISGASATSMAANTPFWQVGSSTFYQLAYSTAKTQIGGATTPVYVNNTGQIVAGTALGTASTHAHTDYVTSITYDSTNKKLKQSKGGGTATDIVTFGSNAFSSTEYLPLSGGTMTGTITALGSQYADTAGTGALNMNNSDIYGVNSIKFADLCNGASEGLQWYRDATHVDSLWVKNGVIYFSSNRTWGGSVTDNTVYHSGNLSIGTLMGSSAIGDGDEPVYWSGSAFVKAGAYPTKASWNYDDVYLKDILLDTGNSTSKDKSVSLTNTNVYLKLFKTINGAEAEDSKVKIYGNTNITVTTDTNGDIKITGVDSVTNASQLGGVSASSYFKTRDYAFNSEWTGKFLWTIWDNHLWAADKRFNVTINGNSSASYSTLFNGNFESSLGITDTTSVIHIKHKTDGTVWTSGLPYGNFYVIFYNSDAENVTARVYIKYSGQGIGWHDLTVTHVGHVWILANSYYEISDLEITITKSASTSTLYISQIMHQVSRSSGPALAAALSKYCDQSTPYNLTAAKFIGPLQGNSDTSTYASNVGASGTVGTNYVTAAKVISACNWYDTMIGTDSDSVINRWSEIVSFVANFEETPDLATFLSNNYLAKAGGQMSGPLTWVGSAALPQQTSPQYFLCIDAFTDGGTTKWASKANTLTALTGLTSTAIGDADEPVYWSGSAFTKCGPFSSSTHDHDSTYLKLSGGTMTGLITSTRAAGEEFALRETRTNGADVGFGVGSGNKNHGVYSFTHSKWLLYANSDDTNAAVYVNGTSIPNNKTLVVSTDIGTAASHAHGDYVTSVGWDSTNNKLTWAKGGSAQTAITVGYATDADTVDGLHADFLRRGSYEGYVCTNILTIQRSDTPKTITIKTKIPFTNGHIMPSIYIRGFAYGLSIPVNLHLVFYIYSSAFCNYGVISYGGWNPSVFLSTYTVDNNKFVAITLTDSNGLYYPRLWVDYADVWNSGNSPRYYKNWTVEYGNTVVEPTSDVKEISYKSLKTSISGSAGSVAWTNVTGKPDSFSPSSHEHSTTDITSGTLRVARGGTGLSTIAIYSLLYASAKDTLSALAPNTSSTKKFLRMTGSGSAGAVPAWDTVTSSDVGLGNVENTALSTWAGSSNITTLGTISNGTWQGTAIGVAYGGTGKSSWTKNGIVYASDTTTLSQITTPSAASKTYWLKCVTNGSGTPSYSFAELGSAASYSHDDYVTSIGTSGNTLTWEKGGVAQTAITVPYATNADTVDSYHATSSGSLLYKYSVSASIPYASVTGDFWYATITFARGYTGELTKSLLTCGYSNITGQVYLYTYTYNGSWYAYSSWFNGCNIKGIAYKSQVNPIYYVKLAKPVTYSGGTPDGTISVYSPYNCTITVSATAPSGVTFNSINAGGWTNLAANTASTADSVAWDNISDRPDFTTWTDTTSTASYNLSRDSWVDTINLPTTAGSYVIQLTTGNSTLTGVFSIGTSDNAKDEISLHLHGNGTRLYARTNGTKLQLSSNYTPTQSNPTQATSVTIKYRRMI